VHEKLEIIVRFLAILELFKQGVIDLEQSESFADLIVLPLAPGERVELDLMSIADLDGEPIDLAPNEDADDRVEEHA
jgi:segregation and condensation protein A